MYITDVIYDIKDGLHVLRSNRDIPPFALVLEEKSWICTQACSELTTLHANSEWMGVCAYPRCRKNGAVDFTCRVCGHVSYCCEKCQAADSSAHKIECDLHLHIISSTTSFDHVTKV